MWDEDWLRNIKLPDITGDDRDKVGEPQRQAPCTVGIKKNANGNILGERATQMEKDAMEKEIREMEDTKRKQFEKVKDVS